MDEVVIRMKKYCFSGFNEMFTMSIVTCRNHYVFLSTISDEFDKVVCVSSISDFG